MPKKKFINLLPQEEFEASIVGRILKWGMGTFRFIVIVTEIVVMGAFLSRFWLDAQNSDLADEIKVKSAQISAQSEFEKNFRQIQTKLNIIKILSQTTKPSDRIDNTVSKMPADIALSSISVQENQITIKGSSASEISIAQFVSNLKNDPGFTKVDIGSVSSSEDNPGIIVFSINISY